MFLTWPPMTAKLWNVLWRQRWTRGSGWVHPENSADMPELGYEKLLVRAGWAISSALSIQARKQSFHLEWPPIPMLRSIFQLEWVHIIWTILPKAHSHTLTIHNACERNLCRQTMYTSVLLHSFQFLTITTPNNKLNPITLGHLTLRVRNGCTHKGRRER